MRVFSVFCFLGTLFPFSLGSQWKLEEDAVEIEIGEPYEVIDARSKHYFSSGDTLFAFKKNQLTIHTQVFDADGLEQVAYKENELEDKKMALESYLKFGGKLYLIYNWWDKDNEVERIFSRELDMRTASLMEAEKLFETKDRMRGTLKKAPGLFGGKKSVDKLDFHFSKNGEWAMAHYYVQDEEFDDEYRVGFLLFDKDLDLEWNTVRTLPYKKERMSWLSYEVTDDGVPYILAQVEDPSDSEEEGPGYRYEIFRIGKEGGGMDHARIDLDRIFVKSFTFASLGTEEEGFRFYGYYNLHEESERRKGIFQFSIDEEGKVKGPHLTPFSMETLLLYEGEDYGEECLEKGIEHPDVGIKWLSVKSSYRLQNGDLLLIGEESYYQEQHRNTNNPHMYPRGSDSRRFARIENNIESYYIYYYNDLLAARLSPSGKLKWMKKVPKNNIAGEQDKASASFRFMKSDGQFYLVYFDHKDNMQLERDQIPDQYSSKDERVLCAYRLNDDNGATSKIPIFEMTDVKGMEVYQYGLNRLMKLDGDGVVLEVYKKNKEDVLIRVDF